MQVCLKLKIEYEKRCEYFLNIVMTRLAKLLPNN